MASRKQIAANRANAKRSTGPRSSSGKARSKRNAITHGLTAADIVVVNERPEEFEAFREDLMADLEPHSVLERELVDRLAGLLWRLRRIPVVEAELLNELASPVYSFDLKNLSLEELQKLDKLLQKTTFQKGPKRLLGAESPDEKSEPSASSHKPEKLPRRVEMLPILSRYEAGLMNAVTRSLVLLRSLQAARAAAKENARTVDG